MSEAYVAVLVKDEVVRRTMNQTLQLFSGLRYKTFSVTELIEVLNTGQPVSGVAVIKTGPGDIAREQLHQSVQNPQAIPCCQDIPIRQAITETVRFIKNVQDNGTYQEDQEYSCP